MKLNSYQMHILNFLYLPISIFLKILLQPLIFITALVSECWITGTHFVGVALPNGDFKKLSLFLVNCMFLKHCYDVLFCFVSKSLSNHENCM